MPKYSTSAPRTSSYILNLRESISEKIIFMAYSSVLSKLPLFVLFQLNTFLHLIYWNVFVCNWFIKKSIFITWDLVSKVVTCCRTWILFFRMLIDWICRFFCQLIFGERVAAIVSHDCLTPSNWFMLDLCKLNKNKSKYQLWTFLNWKFFLTRSLPFRFAIKCKNMLLVSREF